MDLEFIGEPTGARTLDLLIKSQLLYQLSYRLPRVPAGTPKICVDHMHGVLTGQYEKWP